MYHVSFLLLGGKQLRFHVVPSRTGRYLRPTFQVCSNKVSTCSVASGHIASESPAVENSATEHADPDGESEHTAHAGSTTCRMWLGNHITVRFTKTNFIWSCLWGHTTFANKLLAGNLTKQIISASVSSNSFRLSLWSQSRARHSAAHGPSRSSNSSQQKDRSHLLRRFFFQTQQGLNFKLLIFTLLLMMCYLLMDFYLSLIVYGFNHSIHFRHRTGSMTASGDRTFDVQVTFALLVADALVLIADSCSNFKKKHVALEMHKPNFGFQTITANFGSMSGTARLKQGLISLLHTTGIQMHRIQMHHTGPGSGQAALARLPENSRCPRVRCVSCIAAHRTKKMMENHGHSLWRWWTLIETNHICMIYMPKILEWLLPRW